MYYLGAFFNALWTFTPACFQILHFYFHLIFLRIAKMLELLYHLGHVASKINVGKNIYVFWGNNIA